MTRAIPALQYTVAAALLAPVALVACTGGPAFGTESFSGSSGTTSGSSGGTSGTSGGVDASTTCTESAQPGDKACVPSTAPAGKPITVDVGASTGCLGCNATLEPCEVSVSGTTITLAMKTRTCTPAVATPCPALCARVSTTCTIPPLGAGTYTVQVTGESARVPARQLVVAASEGSTSCKLAQTNPSAIAATDYAQGCAVDADCELITTGDPCAPCRCTEGAIAKTQHDTYAGDLRARSSQCATPASSAQCASCPTATAKCSLPAGTCVVGP